MCSVSRKNISTRVIAQSDWLCRKRKQQPRQRLPTSCKRRKAYEKDNLSISSHNQFGGSRGARDDLVFRARPRTTTPAKQRRGHQRQGSRQQGDPQGQTAKALRNQT